MIQKELSQKFDFLQRVKFIGKNAGEKNVYRKNGGRRMVNDVNSYIIYVRFRDRVIEAGR